MIRLKYNKLLRRITTILVAVTIMFSATFIKSDEGEMTSFTDVSYTDWFSQPVMDMISLGVIPVDGERFYPNAPATRQDVILFLYNFAHIDAAYSNAYADVPFVDISRTDRYYRPICWAYNMGIADGYNSTTFNPEGQCTREQLCTIIMRYLACYGIEPKIVGGADMFSDWNSISDYAKSYVLACRLAGFVNGGSGGNFRPKDGVTRAELAKILNMMFISSRIRMTPEDRRVDTSAGAYDWCYEDYKIYLRRQSHSAYVQANPAVDLSYFNDAVFVGDSVSMSLQMYCTANKSLGNAQFLCAGSLSPYNAHWEVSSSSKHPVYKGSKLTVEEAVYRCGAKKVYIMLGINSLGMGVDGCVNDTVKLINKILAKTPDVAIILQSVTPMTATSPIKSSKLNNDVIRQFNAKMLELAEENGWYYVNVSEAVKDQNGNLRMSYCSDPGSMGIHFNFEADKAWVDYLRTHAPQID